MLQVPHGGHPRAQRGQRKGRLQAEAQLTPRAAGTVCCVSVVSMAAQLFRKPALGLHMVAAYT